MNVFKMIFIILCIHRSGKPFNENFEHTYRDLKCTEIDRIVINSGKLFRLQTFLHFVSPVSNISETSHVRLYFCRLQTLT